MNTEKLEYVKEMLKMYDIYVDSNKYIIDYSYEPQGAIYKKSNGKNSKNFNIYIKVADQEEALVLYKEYLVLIKPAIVRKRK